MADITKCMGTGCPLKTNCLRFMQESSAEWQSYFAFVPYKAALETCEEMVEIHKKWRFE